MPSLGVYVRQNSIECFSEVLPKNTGLFCMAIIRDTASPLLLITVIQISLMRVFYLKLLYCT